MAERTGKGENRGTVRRSAAYSERERQKNPLPINAKAARQGVVRTRENFTREMPKTREMVKSVGTREAENRRAERARQKRKETLSVLFTHERLSKFDFPFFIITLILLAFGMVMMFSASYAVAYEKYAGNSYYFITRQAIFAGVGICVMIFLSFFNYHFFCTKLVLTVMVLVSSGLMLLVFFFGSTSGGAERWISLFGIRFQPSEILKFVLIAVFAYMGEKNAARVKELKRGFIPYVVCLGAACALLIIQPHISGTIIVGVIGMMMMFVSGCRVKHLLVLLGLALVAAVLGYFLLNALGFSFIQNRILGWQNPEADIEDATFQTYQSLLTIGSGGVFGLGLGNSRQKYFYLPESQNDFVFSIICEELGFFGAVFVILLFIIFVVRGFYIASRARDRFGMLMAMGITFQLGLQALLNIGVATNAIPNTGISLPFFSYGGSALLMQLAEVGIVLNISRKAVLE